MTDDRIEKLRELAEKATPGPWEIWSGNPWHANAPNHRLREKGDNPPQVFQTGNSNHGFFYRDGAMEQAKADAAFIAESRTAIPFLLSLYDSQQQRIGELEGAERRLAEEVAEEKRENERLRSNWKVKAQQFMDDIDLVVARASRAEQALKEAPAKILDAVGKFSDEPLTIDDALRCLREYRELTEDWQTNAAERIRALSSLPTPPQQEQTRTKTWAYDKGLRLYICGVCDYAGDTEDELKHHDCKVALPTPPEEEV